MITVDLLMSTKPCPNWPRERVEALLARPDIDCSSWVRFSETCLAADAVSLADLRITAYRAATPAQRLVGVRRSVRVRVKAQIKRWPKVSTGVAATRAYLLRWCAGAKVDLSILRHRAPIIHDAAASDDADAAYYADDASVCYAADAASYSYAAEAHASLLFICNVLDRNLTDDGRPDELALCERAQRGCR